MAESQAPGNPLDVLPAMLNLMLVQTGKFFKDAASDQPTDITTAKTQLAGLGDSANRRFHEALDELEIEITRAKAVFERDLRKERAKRAERERAAGILTRPAGVTKARSPITGTMKSPPRASAEKQAKDEGVQVDSKTKDEKAEDLVMVNGIDSSDELKAEKGAPKPSQPEPPAQEPINDTKPASKATDEPSNPSATPSEAKPEPAKPDQPPEKTTPPKPTEASISIAPQQPENPVATENFPISTKDEPASFESMFTDLVEPPSNPSTTDIDFSLSDPFADTVDFSTIDMANTQAGADLNATSSEDINTLLPGLENYVNDSGDLSFDFPTTAPIEQPAAPTTTTSGVVEATLAAGAAQGLDGVHEVEVEMEPVESTFDDLFGSGDWGGDGDGDLDDGAMADFDEDWFKTDG